MAKKSVTSEIIRLTNVRGAFVQLDKPTKIGKSADEVPKYRLTALLDPSNKAHAEVIARIGSEGGRIAKAFWPDGVPPGLPLCYGRGNDLRKVYNGFKDMVYVKLSNKDLPGIIGREKTQTAAGKMFQQLIPGAKEFPKGGNILNVDMSLWTQDSHGRVGINGNLLAVQYVKDDGVSYGGGQRIDVDNDFAELPAAGDSGEAAGVDPFKL